MHKYRRACSNCMLVEPRSPDELCIHCSYPDSMGSEDFEAESMIHQRNQQRLERARDLVASLEYEVETFEKAWDLTWNIGTGQVEFNLPEDIETIDHIIDFW